MKIYKITEASEYLGVSINTLKSKRDVADAVLKDGAVAAVRKNTVDIAGAM